MSTTPTSTSAERFSRGSVKTALTLGAALTLVNSFLGALLADSFGGPRFLIAILIAPGYVSRVFTGDNVHSSWFIPAYLIVGTLLWSLVALPFVRIVKRKKVA